MIVAGRGTPHSHRMRMSHWIRMGLKAHLIFPTRVALGIAWATHVGWGVVLGLTHMGMTHGVPRVGEGRGMAETVAWPFRLQVDHRGILLRSIQ